ncbi:uncharacterized protein TNIN_31241 [Trichonephila inaurata madagascariensis]|uniref:MADF domain-containing protein n=1 Tax=Trichonephila inaurata madagascariensis TaxID=2747483 RepID=A0A8X6Y2L2_9ARAC|nr:uncharacterized protein TNIN_31241 [Trichonephila inaurata madagascariensis]
MKTVFKLADKVAAFKAKLELWGWRVNRGIFDMFHTLAGILGDTEPEHSFSQLVHDYLSLILKEFERYFPTTKDPRTEICTAKFQNLRTYYRNEKKKLSSFTSVTGARDFAPKWEHFTRLQFLDDTIEPLDSTSNLDYMELEINAVHSIECQHGGCILECCGTASHSMQ